MGQLRNFVTPLHQATSRSYVDRMVDDKVSSMVKAKQYEFDYWDGDRKYGYGGYRYIPGRWKSVAQALIDTYKLKSGSRILDVGCGKGFLLYEMQKIEPNLELFGFDISKHAISSSPKDLHASLSHHKAQDIYPFDDDYFDLVISLGCLHNVRIFELETALFEIERVGRQGYVMMESYQNEQELFNLECWALTCESFFDSTEWLWLFRHFGYTGDYEFIYFV